MLCHVGLDGMWMVEDVVINQIGDSDIVQLPCFLELLLQDSLSVVFINSPR
jgi:hypothetical protein